MSELEVNAIAIIKNIFIDISVIYMFYKIRGKKNITFQLRDLFVTIIGIFIAALCSYEINNNLNTSYALIASFIIQSIVCKLIDKEISKSIVTGVMISDAIVHINFVIAMLIEGAIKRIVFGANDYGIIDLTIIIAIATFINIAMFKIRRINKGFQFLKEKINNEYLDIIMINISIGVIFIYSLFLRPHKRSYFVFILKTTT